MTYGTDVIQFSNVSYQIRIVFKYVFHFIQTLIPTFKFSEKQMNQENRSDPMVEIFPRITKCTFHKYGASGSIDAEAFCLNTTINERFNYFRFDTKA